MSEATFRAALPTDVETLARLQDAFYREAGSPFEWASARRAWARLLADPRLGRAWIAVSGVEPVGYVVLTFAYSLEYGGLNAVVDDLYVVPAWRKRGLGAAALRLLDEACRKAGVTAVHLEVDRENARAEALYERSGFERHRRVLMTKRMAGAEAEAHPPPQSYRSPKTVVRGSPIQGRGLFAREPIARGEIVVIKGGHVLDRGTLQRVQASLGPAEIQITDSFFIGPVAEADREGGMIFSNHCCEPNIGVQGQIVFVALRDIAAGEELTHDWATTDDDTYEMECRCGAPSCRRVVTGQDWRRKDLQEKYRGFMSWYLQRKIDSQIQ